eukprot:scaffold293835_cov23-Tisochrysis_lutea.AAC.1
MLNTCDLPKLRVVFEERAATLSVMLMVPVPLGARRLLNFAVVTSALRSKAAARGSPVRLQGACGLGPWWSSCNTPLAWKTIDTWPDCGTKRSPKCPASSSTSWMGGRLFLLNAPSSAPCSDSLGGAGAGHASTLVPDGSKSAPPASGLWRSSVTPLGRMTLPPPRASKAMHVLPSR